MRNTTLLKTSVGSSDTTLLIITFYIFLATTALAYIDFVPRSASYMLVVVAYGILIVLGLTRDINILKIPRYALWSLGIIWFLYLLNLGISVITSDIQISTLIRVPPFIIFTGINIFILPKLIPIRVFFNVLANFATALVVLAIPTLFISQYGIGPIQIERWGSTFQLLPGIEIQIHSIKSVFRNPNTLSFITAVGIIAAFDRYFEYRDRRSKAQLIFLIIGLYFAHGRASMAAAVIGLGLIFTYILFSKKSFQILSILAFSVGSIAFLIIGGIIPAPSIIPTINLRGRFILWEAGMRAVASQPLYGYGPGHTGEIIAPFVGVDRYSGAALHNSYMRLFVTTGILGGVSYLLLIFKIISDQFFKLMTKQDLVLFVLCIVLAIIQFFESFSLFGLSLASVVASSTYGYGIQTIIPDDKFPKNIFEFDR